MTGPLRAKMRVPPYFDYLIDAFVRGAAARTVHLGYWDAPPQAASRAEAGYWTAREFADAQARLDDRVLALGGFAAGQSVLDVGCGFGGTLEALQARHPSLRMCGVNVDLRQLRLCRTLRTAPGSAPAWIGADACALPFADASFDRVLCVEAMFHFPSRRAFFREAARVLAPGGALVATDMTVAASARALDTPSFPIARTLDEGYGPWPDFWGDDADHRALGAAAGLDCASLSDIAPHVLPSHLFTSPAGLSIQDALASPDANAALRAALMLKWLHTEGHLRYPCMRFDKPGGRIR